MPKIRSRFAPSNIDNQKYLLPYFNLFPDFCAFSIAGQATAGRFFLIQAFIKD